MVDPQTSQLVVHLRVRKLSLKHKSRQLQLNTHPMVVLLFTIERPQFVQYLNAILARRHHVVNYHKRNRLNLLLLHFLLCRSQLLKNHTLCQIN